MTNNFVVLIMKGCPYCDLALDLLDERKIPYKLLTLNIDFQREDLDKIAPGAKTYPQILINGYSIGGYDDLVEKIDYIVSQT